MMQLAEARMRAAGLTRAMVEPVDDSGHAPARATCEAAGCRRWPVARHFRQLD